MSNEYPQFSVIHQKKQAFHKQIRSKIRQQYFASQRKMLFQTQWMTMASQNKQGQGFNRVVINSSEQLQAHLSNAYVPDYAAIGDYLQSENHQPLPQHIISTIISNSQQASFMKNEHALILLIKLFNTTEFNREYWLTQQRVKYYVHKVIEDNMILEDPHHRIYRLDFFTTVCWFLYVVSILAKDKGLMMELKGHLSMMQAQAYHQLPAEFIFLLSQLSTCSQLLPSQQFIQRLLSYEPLQTQPFEYSIHLVNLLDNYLRYRCQQLYRFDDQESQQLTVEYFRFIIKKIKNLKFPNKLKIDLINLVITIVRCAQEELVVQLFNKPESKQLCSQLFYRAQFAQWQAKSVSFECFLEILSRQELLPKVIEYIDPAKITNLLVNSLTLPDRMFQMNSLACIMCLLSQQYNVFKNLFKNSNFKRNIRYLEISDQKNYQLSGEKDSLAECAQSIYQIYLYEEQKFVKYFQNQRSFS